MEKAHGYQSRFFIVSNEDGPVGGQLLFKKKIFFFLTGYEALGGPLYVDDCGIYVVSSVIKHFQNLGGLRVAYKLIRPQCPHNFENKFTKNNFSISPFQTFLLDLSCPIDQIWMNLKKNARWGITKGQKLNVEVIEATQWDDWKIFYEMQQRHSKIHLYSTKPPEFMEGLFKISYPKNMAKLFIAIYKGEIIAGMLFLICQDTMVYYAGASEYKYSHLLANDLLMWHAIQWGNAHNIKYLNLEDTYPKKSSNLYGIHKFKEKWGGKLTKRDFYIDGDIYVFGRSLVLDNKICQKIYAIIHERNLI